MRNIGISSCGTYPANCSLRYAKIRVRQIAYHRVERSRLWLLRNFSTPFSEKLPWDPLPESLCIARFLRKRGDEGMHSLLTRLWEWRRLGHLIQSVIAGLTELSCATLLAASPGRKHEFEVTGLPALPGRRVTPPESHRAARRPGSRVRTRGLMLNQVTATRPVKGSPVTARAPSRPFHARDARETCRTRAAARARATGRSCPRSTEPTGTRPRLTQRSRWVPARRC